MSGLSPTLRPAGALDDVVRALVPYQPSSPNTRLLVVACGVRAHFPWDLACERYALAVAEVEAAVAELPIEVVRCPEPFEDPSALVNALDTELGREGLQGIILFHAAYTAGEIGSHLGRWLLDHPMPLYSWSFPDPGGGTLTANSLCCQNFLLGMLHRLGVRYAWQHAPIEANARPAIRTFARSSRAAMRFRHATILHAGGSRVSAFYDGETDELAVMRRFGARFDRVDLETIYQFSRRFTDADVAKLVDALKSSPLCDMVDLPDTQIAQTYRFGLALLALAHEQGYAAATFKSWPDLFDCYGCAIDGAVSMLNDVGFTVSEEGEMNGALTSLAMTLVSEGTAVPTLMDLSGLNTVLNTISLWHCGACPTRWLKANALLSARKHSILEQADPDTAIGLNLEFPLALGPVTVARYQSPDAARSFIFEGELIESPPPFRGNWGEMRPVSDGPNAAAIMGTILDQGLDHHWSLGFGHWSAELRQLNRWLGVAEVAADSPANNHR